MRIPLLLFFTLFCLCSLPLAQAQDKELSVMAPYILGGKWTGKLTQKQGGIAQEYTYEVDLTLTGNKLKGKGVIKTSTMYGYFEMEGSFTGNQIQLEDIRITNENIKERAAWCIKTMPLKLVFRNGAYWLEGPWSGYSKLGNCMPGQVFLTKSAIKA